MIKNYRITVTGQLQEHGFRGFVELGANVLGITGWVKYLSDNKVEIEAEGTDEKLQQLVERCKKGPKGAEIQDVAWTEGAVQSYSAFEVK